VMGGKWARLGKRLGWLLVAALSLAVSYLFHSPGALPTPPDEAPLVRPDLAQRGRALDLLSRVGAVPLARGLAVVPLWGVPDQAFHNPAGIAGISRLSLTHNHSFRHFPLDEEVDLIDADTEVVVFPIPGGFTAAYATTLRGEHGWDYLKLANTRWEEQGFPIERSDGFRDVLALAYSPLPLFSLGAALVTEEARQFDRQNRLVAIHQGQGMETGYLLRLLGFSWGSSRLKLDFDTFDLASRRQLGWRMVRRLSGLALTPTPWLSYSTQWGEYQTRPPQGSLLRQDEPRSSSLALTVLPGVTLYLARRGRRAHWGVGLRMGSLWVTGALGEGTMGELFPPVKGEQSNLGIYGVRLDLPW